MMRSELWIILHKNKRFVWDLTGRDPDSSLEGNRVWIDNRMKIQFLPILAPAIKNLSIGGKMLICALLDEMQLVVCKEKNFYSEEQSKAFALFE